MRPFFALQGARRFRVAFRDPGTVPDKGAGQRRPYQPEGDEAMTAQPTVAMCLPHRRDDLPAYARTGQLHSGHQAAEIQSRCIALLYAIHGADHDEGDEAISRETKVSQPR